MSSGTSAAIVPTAVSTIIRGCIRRYLSRSGSSTHDARGSPSSSGIAAPPVPTITLANRSGCAAAAKSAADVPTSGATMCGRPRSASATSRARNPPIARGDRRSSRRSDPPNPGRSTANRRACSASVAHIGPNAYRLSGHGLVSRITGACQPPLSAYRIRRPSTARNCGSIDAVSEVFIVTPSEIRRCRRCSRADLGVVEQAERGRGGGPEDEVRAQVLGERLQVVLPDRLVDAEQRENDVSGCPDRGPERQSVPQLRRAPRAEEQAVAAAGGEAETPVRGVVEEPRVRRRKLVPEHALEQPLGHQRRRRSVLPAVEARGGLPRREGDVATVVAVAAVERCVHRERPGPARGDPPHGRTDRAHDSAATVAPVVAAAPSLRASIALTLLANALPRTPLPTVPSTSARNRPLALLPSRISPATYCSGVRVVASLKWIVDMAPPVLVRCGCGCRRRRPAPRTGSGARSPGR